MKYYFRIMIITVLLMMDNYSQTLSKVYVLSEGGFSPASSKLSTYDVNTNTFQLNSFNPGQIGSYPDGLIIYENHLYLLEQGNYGGSGKIYKLDTNGTVINSAVVGTNPYSLAIANSKIYITNGPKSKLSVLNLSDFSLLKEITVGAYPQEIIAHENKIYVANTSVWGGAADSTISVIDALTDTFLDTLLVRKDPASLAISSDGNLLVGCPGDSESGRIFKYSTTNHDLIETYVIQSGGFGKEINVDKNTGELYFIAYTNDIVKMNLSSKSSAVIIPSIFPANFFYGYSFDYVNKVHYVLDANDFVVSGELIIYNQSGVQQNVFNTGLAPRRVVLKYNGIPASVNEENVKLSSFNLYQNYPNPFNPTTNINYSLSKNSEVVIKVFDYLGREVATLVNSEKESGNHTVQFNAKGLSSGIYFYSIKADGFSEVKKMHLIK